MAIIGGRAHTIEQIHAVGRMGYPFAEISVKDPGEIAPQLDELLELKSAYGISYLAHYPNEDNPFDAKMLQERFVPRMQRLFELSEALGIRKGTIHFWMDRRWVSPGLVSQKIGLLFELVEYATRLGVVLCIENLSERHDSFVPVLEAIPALRMTLDIGHAQLLSRENTAFGFIEHCFPQIDHIHVHDNRGGTSVDDDLHLPLGEGIIDFPRIFTLLREKGYRSTITMEIQPPEMPRTRDAIRQYFD